MKYLAPAAAALLATTSLATAGGIERNATSMSILFEEGTYAELSFAMVSPRVSGADNGFGTPSGEIAPSYSYPTLSYRQDLTDALSFAFIMDQPYGADVSFPGPTGGLPGGFPFALTEATLRTQQFSAILRYEMENNVSVYGGLRALAVTEGDIYVSAAPTFGYSLNATSDYELGYLIGAAYEIPDIALRVALTYFSEVDLTLTGGFGVGGPAPAARPAPATPERFNVTMPQSVLLEAQSGIAADTLLFGSIRWVEWGQFNITPSAYPAGNLVDLTDDTWTYNLGVGRRLSDMWSVSSSLTYEREHGGFSGNLQPTDGKISLGLGAEYTMGNISIAGGLSHTWLGNADTCLNAACTATSTYTDNTAWAGGVRIGINF